MRNWKIISGVLFVVLLTVVFTVGWTPRNSGLHGVWNIIQKKEFVDLTHTFEPGIRHWPGFPDEERELLFWYMTSHLGQGRWALASTPSLSHTSVNGPPM